MTSIVVTPGTIGGKPRIDGRRIGVHHIAVWHYHMDMGIDEMSAQFDLTRDEIGCALAYYDEHRDEIDSLIRDEEAVVTQIRAGV